VSTYPTQRRTWVGSIRGLGWVGSHFPAHVMGWVGLNEKYCGIVAEYCKTHTFHSDVDILFPLFLRRHTCEIKDMH